VSLDHFLRWIQNLQTIIILKEELLRSGSLSLSKLSNIFLMPKKLLASSKAEVWISGLISVEQSLWESGLEAVKSPSSLQYTRLPWTYNLKCCELSKNAPWAARYTSVIWISRVPYALISQCYWTYSTLRGTCRWTSLKRPGLRYSDEYTAKIAICFA